MEQPIKVIHIIGGGEYGGAEEHILQLITHMPQHKVHVKVITFYDAKFSQTLKEKGIDVFVLDQYNRFDFRIFSGLKSIFEQERPDIIHTHGVKANFFGRIAAKQSGIGKLITTVHSLLKYDYPNPIAYFITYLMEKSTRRYVTQFIAVSYAIEKQLKAEGQKEEQISVIHHGIDVDHFYVPESKNDIRQELSIPEDCFVVGMIARMVKVKGISDFVNAANELLKQNQKFHFVIVGDGPEELSIHKQIQEKGLQDHFTLPGFRTDTERCLSGFDCFVSSSISEGLGLSVLEAMAAQIPVVATGVGGVLDFLKDHENGLVVPVHSPTAIANAVMQLKEDQLLREKLMKQARRDVEEKFSIERMAKDTFELYDQLSHQ